MKTKHYDCRAGHAAYIAYCSRLNFKNPETGESLLDFNSLSEDVQDAWMAVIWSLSNELNNGWRSGIAFPISRTRKSLSRDRHTRLSDVISTPDRWSRHALAVDENCDACSPLSDCAIRRSLWGAVYLVSDNTGVHSERFTEAIRQACIELRLRDDSLYFEGYESTSHEMVLSVAKRADELIENEVDLS